MEASFLKARFVILFFQFLSFEPMTGLTTSLTLLERLVDKRDEGAWQIFVEIYKPFIARSLLNVGISAPDVEDLTQDCLAKMISTLPRFQHNGRTGAFRKWLRTVVGNPCIGISSTQSNWKMR